jgi:hypothetical protein
MIRLGVKAEVEVKEQLPHFGPDLARASRDPTKSHPTLLGLTLRHPDSVEMAVCCRALRSLIGNDKLLL